MQKDKLLKRLEMFELLRIDKKDNTLFDHFKSMKTDKLFIKFKTFLDYATNFWTMSFQAGEFIVTELINNEYAALYISKECSDITLYIEGQKIPAHRSIIGERCEYLETYFSNGLNEPKQTKFELNVPLEAFKVLLKYFYTGQMSLSKINNVETLIQILSLVEEYRLFHLKTHFENYFKRIISFENTCTLLEVAKTYELKELEIKSLKLIDTNADQILASESFKKIPKDLLEGILTRDTFNASSELSIFYAVEKWSKHANQNIETVIHLVNLPLLPLKELLQIRKSGILTGDKIFDAIEKQLTTKPAPRSHIQRFGYLPEQNENVASSKYNVRTVQGDVQKDGLIKYRHRIGDGSSIIIELEQIFIINNLIMELWNNRGYFIEISTDQKKWERIIDYSSFKCTSMQNLYFPPEPVKYVKIVGTCSSNKFFELETFEAYYYRKKIPKIRNGIVVPKDFQNFEFVCWDRNSFVISYGQPYYIGSMRFNIVGGNADMKYKFYIETSLNRKDWENVVDKIDEFVNGRQTFRFTSRPIVCIRITPTACSISGEINFWINFFHIN